jgi:hypothetical protein
VRAVIIELALASIHQELRRDAVLQWLARQGIRQIQSGAANAVTPTTSPPNATGIRRSDELQQIAQLRLGYSSEVRSWPSTPRSSELRGAPRAQASANAPQIHRQEEQT